MKDNFTYVAIVLDRSGSMHSAKQATIDGFNEFLQQQKSSGRDTRLLLAQFDHEYEVVYDKPIAEAQPLNHWTYCPRGTTALLDAMGRTIVDLGKKLAAMAEAERPSRVLVCIITDGYENTSSDYNEAQIASLVKQQQTKYSWGFVFIGANQDAVLTAGRYHICPQCALSYNTNPTATRAMSQSLSAYTSAYASAANPQTVAFTQEDRTAAAQ